MTDHNSTIVPFSESRKDKNMNVIFSDLRDDVKQFINAAVIHNSDRTILLPKVVEEVTRHLDERREQGRHLSDIHVSFDPTKLKGVDINQRIRAMLNMMTAADDQRQDTISVSRPALTKLLETAHDSVQKLRAIRYLDVISNPDIPEDLRKQYAELRESILSLELRILTMNCQELFLK